MKKLTKKATLVIAMFIMLASAVVVFAATSWAGSVELRKAEETVTNLVVIINDIDSELIALNADLEDIKDALGADSVEAQAILDKIAALERQKQSYKDQRDNAYDELELAHKDAIAMTLEICVQLDNLPKGHKKDFVEMCSETEHPLTT